MVKGSGYMLFKEFTIPRSLSKTYARMLFFDKLFVEKLYSKHETF